MTKHIRFAAHTILLVLVFVIGWVASVMYMNVGIPSLENPLSLDTLLKGNIEMQSPQDHISEDSIHVFEDRVIIDVEEATWSTFTNTNSMDPILDVGANGLEMKPKTPADIKVGDVVSYKPDSKNGLVIHRIVATGYDGEGWFARAKGDNNPTVDPGKIRFDQIHGVLIGVIY